MRTLWQNSSPSDENLKIDPAEILSPTAYAKERDAINRSVIGIERERRISTRTFTFLFENKDTVLNQINEMVYLEKIEDAGEIGYLIDVYSGLLPSPGVLSVSMFIEITNPDRLLSEMPNLAGIEKNVYIVFDGNELRGEPEEGRSTETLESTLQYLKFRFTTEMKGKFAAASNVFLETRHKGYSESARIPAGLHDVLKKEI